MTKVITKRLASSLVMIKAFILNHYRVRVAQPQTTPQLSNLPSIHIPLKVDLKLQDAPHLRQVSQTSTTKHLQLFI